MVLLKITNNDGNWHYLAVKSISKWLNGITSKHNRDFYCLNCFHSYRTKNKLIRHEKICKDHDFCYVKMPDKNNKILKYNPGENSLKIPFIIYADIECLLKKIDTCQNNPEKSYAQKPSGYSLVTWCSFDKSKNECKYYRGKDRMEMFCKDLRDQTMKIIYYEKKEMIPLTDEEESLIKNKKSVIYVKKNLYW